MAERKLRIDAAEAAAIPHPRIRMPAHDDQSVATEIGIAKSSEKVPPIDEAPDESTSTLERAVRQKLMSDPDVNISSLVVRQIEGGVCLEGVLKTNNDLTDVDRLVQSVASVDRVLNRLTLRPPDASTGCSGHSFEWQ
ncbi:MAG: osmotically-inducible protein OsmY [Planctomycetaceae bacterium]|jgi:osmotically-inducible protein OsmY